VVIPRGR